MDLSTIYTKTGRGVRAQIKKLPPHAGQVLSVMGAKSSGGDIYDKLKKVNGLEFDQAITWLLEGGFIKAIVQDTFSDSMWAPVTQSAISVSEISIDEFNQSMEARERVEAETRAKAAVEAKTQAELEAQEKAAAEAKASENAKIEAKLGENSKTDEELRKEAIAREKAEVEAKAQADAITKAEADSKAKLEALTRADEEARERAEAQLKAMVEAKEKAEAEAKAREELEAQEKIKASEIAKKGAEAEAKKQAEVEAEVQAEKAARDEQAARVRTKAEAKAAAEAKKKSEAEAKALAKAEAKALARAELLAKNEARQAARKEAVAKERAEKEAKALAEVEAKKQAEAAAKAEQAAREHAEALAQAEAEAKEKAAAEAKKQAELEAKKQAEAAARVRTKAAAKAKRKAEFLAKMSTFKSLFTKKIQQISHAFISKRSVIDKSVDLPDVKSAIKPSTKKVTKQKILSALSFTKYALKRLFKYALLLLVLAVVTAQFINLSMLVNPLERLAKENMGESVNIEAIHASIFPAFNLQLEHVSIGDSAPIKAQNVRIFADVSSLLKLLSTNAQTSHQISTVQVEGLDISQQDLTRPVAWLTFSNNLNHLKIKNILVKNASVHLNELVPLVVEGDIQLNGQGQLNNATFFADDKHLIVDVSRANNRYNLDIKAQMWRSPMPPTPLLTSLNAKGFIENDVLTLSAINGVLYDGQLKATMTASLTGAWSTKGNLELSGVDLAKMADDLKLSSAIDGDFKANGNYAFNYNLANNQIEAPTLNGRFEAKNGHIKKVDLIVAMHNNSANIGGSTHFKVLSGNLLLNNQSFQFTNLTLHDNQLEAYGRLEIASNGLVNGDIYSKIPLKSNPIKAHLMITGPIDSLKLKK